MIFPTEEINKLKKNLNQHPLLNGRLINNKSSLKLFMEHHVFAVWDFMSLVKSLQNHLCQSSDCWVPGEKSRKIINSARLINEIVLAEETDYNLDGKNIISHFDLYCEAMLEIGADITQIHQWLSSLNNGLIPINFNNNLIPSASSLFVKKTFEFISTKKPHIIAAAFSFGRETVIPEMFTRLVSQLELTEISCPKLFYYLARHIEIDGEEHGPASYTLVENLCEKNTVLIQEAEKAAIESIQSRIKFWDNVAAIIELKEYSQDPDNRGSILD
jgi:hypothetical protein